MENVNKPSTSIKNWAIDDRPREKLLSKGAEALSNAELLAILINNGSKNKSAVELAKEILKLGHDNLNELGKLSLTDFKKVKGIGEAKSITVAAALELGRRRHAAAALEKIIVKSSKDIAQYLRVTLKDYSYEVFAVIFLTGLATFLAIAFFTGLIIFLGTTFFNAKTTFFSGFTIFLLITFFAITLVFDIAFFAGFALTTDFTTFFGVAAFFVTTFLVIFLAGAFLFFDEALVFFDIILFFFGNIEK